MNHSNATPLDVMREQLPIYFGAEKSEALLFVLIGLAAIGVSVWLVASHNSYRGMAYPLVVIALIQLTVGWTVYSRTDDQVTHLTAQLTDDQSAFVAEETPRMSVVMRNFNVYKGIEVALILVGLLTTVVWPRSDVLYAVGVGLVLQASLMVVLDLFAEKRAHDYTEALRSLGIQ